MRSSENEIIRRAIKDHGLWVKKASKGPYSLMRAASNAIYFTEHYHSELQQRILMYFREEVKSDDRCFRHLIGKQDYNLFLKNPNLPQFESLNLEILAHLIRKKIKLYYFNGQVLSTNIFMKKLPETIRIVKMRNNHYVSATSRKLREVYVECQNVVLSLVETVLDGEPFEVRELNGGKLLNFELILDEAKSVSTQKSNLDKNDFDFKTFLYADRNCSESNTNGSLSYSDRQSVKLESIGTDVVPQLGDRRKANQSQAKNLNATKIAELSSNSMDHLISTSQPEKSNALRPPLVSKEIFDPRPQVPQLNNFPKMFENFSQMAISTNFNLSQSINVNNLESIFQEANKNKSKPEVEFLSKIPEQVHREPQITSIPESRGVGHADQHWRKPYRHPFNHYPDEKSLNEVFSQNQNKMIDRPIKYSMNTRNNDFTENSFRHPQGLPNESRMMHYNSHMQYGEYAPYINPVQNYKQLTQTKHIGTVNKINTLNLGKWNDRKIEDHRFPTTNHRNSTNDPYVRNHHEKPDRGFEYKEEAVQNPHSFIVPETQLTPNNYQPSHLIQSTEKNKPSKKSKKHQFHERHDTALFTGNLKFFDEKNGFGFITIQDDVKPYDVFVYKVEFQRAKLDLDSIIKLVRSGQRMFFRFQIAYYCGKYEMSKKAINLALLEDSLSSTLN